MNGRDVTRHNKHTCHKVYLLCKNVLAGLFFIQSKFIPQHVHKFAGSSFSFRMEWMKICVNFQGEKRHDVVFLPHTYVRRSIFPAKSGWWGLNIKKFSSLFAFIVILFLASGKKLSENVNEKMKQSKKKKGKKCTQKLISFVLVLFYCCYLSIETRNKDEVEKANAFEKPLDFPRWSFY